jgi:hypothetical protein
LRVDRAQDGGLLTLGYTSPAAVGAGAGFVFSLLTPIV